MNIIDSFNSIISLACRRACKGMIVNCSKLLLAAIACLLVTTNFSCTKKETGNTLPTEVSLFKNPEHFPAPAYRLENNTITLNGFELGKKLFYDVQLSATRTVSCASCHDQSDAFADAGNAFSTGINNLKGVRNSPAIMNLAWNPVYMWDGGVADLDLQPIAPLTNHLEMGESVANIIERLNQDNAYRTLFKKTFNEDKVTSVAFLKALSQFMLLCISDQSKYDSMMRKQASFTEPEQKGYLFFKQHCNSCHTEPLFTANTFKNNGIATADSGRYLVTLRPEDLYTFKVPSLRNLKYTAPYMHNGALNSLEEVLDFYSRPKTFAYTDPSVKNGIALTKEERQQLLAFLNTLNDEKFVTNKLLSAP